MSLLEENRAVADAIEAVHLNNFNILKQALGCLFELSGLPF